MDELSPAIALKFLILFLILFPNLFRKMFHKYFIFLDFVSRSVYVIKYLILTSLSFVWLAGWQIL